MPAGDDPSPGCDRRLSVLLDEPGGPDADDAVLAGIVRRHRRRRRRARAGVAGAAALVLAVAGVVAGVELPRSRAAPMAASGRHRPSATGLPTGFAVVAAPSPTRNTSLGAPASAGQESMSLGRAAAGARQLFASASDGIAVRTSVTASPGRAVTLAPAGTGAADAWRSCPTARSITVEVAGSGHAGTITVPVVSAPHATDGLRLAGAWRIGGTGSSPVEVVVVDTTAPGAKVTVTFPGGRRASMGVEDGVAALAAPAPRPRPGTEARDVTVRIAGRSSSDRLVLRLPAAGALAEPLSSCTRTSHRAGP